MDCYRLFIILRRDCNFVKKYFIKNKGIFTISIFSTIISSCLDVGVAFVLQFIINASTEGDIGNLLWIGLGCMFFMLVYAVAKCFNSIIVRKCIKNILIQLKYDLIVEIISKDTNKFRNKNIAEYISYITNDINIIEKEYLESFFSLLTIVFNFVLGCISITVLNKSLSVIAIGIGILVLAAPILFGRRLKILKEEYSKSLSAFTIKIKDIFSGFELIKSYSLEKKVICEFENANVRAENTKYKMYRFNAYLSAVSSTINYFTICLVLIIVGIYVIQGSLTIGAAIAAMQLLDFIINPINTIGIYINKIKTNTPIINNLISNYSKKGSNGFKVITGINKEICLKDVSYSYDGQTNVLKNIGYSFKKNKKYVIVGNSGGGKSTLLQIINGSLDGFSGRITLDGIDINTIDTKALNKLVSIIHQNVFVFDDTIKNNITLFDNNICETDVVRIMKIVGLENLIRTKGLKGMAGENGEYLSGGEKQRIAIARALIKNAQLLLLDEATSALDMGNSFCIENMLLDIPDLTIIVVTHKFIKENLKKYDCILAIKDGQLIEAGTFDQLIDKKGYFYSLFSIMYGGNRSE